MRTILYITILLLSLNYCWAQKKNVLFEKAKGEFVIGNYSNAITYCNQALEKNKELIDVNFLAGLACYNLKDTINAINYFTKEIQVNKIDYRPFLYRAKLNTKTYRISNNDFLLALELQPSNFLVYVEKGNLNYYHLKYNEAIGDYTKAISLRSNLDGANYKLGFCHFYLKDTIKACKTWDKVGELDDFEEYEFIKTICKK